MVSSPFEEDTRRARTTDPRRTLRCLAHGEATSPSGTPRRTGTLGCPPRLPDPLPRAAPDVCREYGPGGGRRARGRLCHRPWSAAGGLEVGGGPLAAHGEVPGQAGEQAGLIDRCGKELHEGQGVLAALAPRSEQVGVRPLAELREVQRGGLRRRGLAPAGR